MTHTARYVTSRHALMTHTTLYATPRHVTISRHATCLLTECSPRYLREHQDIQNQLDHLSELQSWLDQSHSVVGELSSLHSLDAQQVKERFEKGRGG